MFFVQAEVEGQTITWLTPHALQQVVPDDVDIPTMLNFLQIYQVSLILFLIFNLK
jgi:pescadillo protein